MSDDLVYEEMVYDEIDRFIFACRARENSQFKYMIRKFFVWEWPDDGIMEEDDQCVTYKLFKTKKEARVYFNNLVYSEDEKIGLDYPFYAEFLKVEYDPKSGHFNELEYIDSK